MELGQDIKCWTILVTFADHTLDFVIGEYPTKEKAQEDIDRAIEKCWFGEEASYRIIDVALSW